MVEKVYNILFIITGILASIGAIWGLVGMIFWEKVRNNFLFCNVLGYIVFAGGFSFFFPYFCSFMIN